MLDTGENMMRLSFIDNKTARNNFRHGFSKLISIFDRTLYTVVDRGTNPAARYVEDQVRSLQSQVCQIPTEDPWTLEKINRLNKLIHGAV